MPRGAIQTSDQLRNLAAARGRHYWRGLEELAGDADFVARLRDEFPAAAWEWPDALSRRNFLKVMGASIALAGLTGCVRAPTGTIVPYVRQPAEMVPGRPLYYATALPIGGFARGVVVEQHEGRPTKIEGNPDHPGSVGATDAITQAAILDLYDPDRSKVITRYGAVSSWGRFVQDMGAEMARQRATNGASMRILTESVTSPTLAAQIRELLTILPAARWHQFDAVGRDNIRAGATLAYGQPLSSVYDFAKAKVIVSLDANFLIDDPGSVRYARDFFAKRRVVDDRSAMNRLYVAEGTPSITGTMADHRLSRPGSQLGAIAAALAAKMGVAGIVAPALDAYGTKWVDAAAADLKSAGTGGLVLAGESAPPAAHAVAHAINASLTSAAVTLTDPIEAEPVIGRESLGALVKDMQAGLVETLLILGGNPCYTSPAEFEFNNAMPKIRLRVRLGIQEDETSQLCHWHIPESHALEAWSDARGHDGTVSIVQPLIAPLYNSKSSHELLAALLGHSDADGHEIIRGRWAAQHGGDDFETWWRSALEKGVIPNSSAHAATPSLNAAVIAAAIPLSAPTTTTAQTFDAVEICFRPDPCIADGSLANNGWMQELPKPLTKLTWDNAALLSPATAEALGVWNNDHVEITAGGAAVTAPVWVLPGQPDRCVTLHLGYGRWRAGRVGTAIGFNVYPLRTADNPWYARGLVRKTDGKSELAATHTHQTMDSRKLPVDVPGSDTEVIKNAGENPTAEQEIANRNLVRVGTLEQFRADPDFVKKMNETPGQIHLSLYPGYEDVYKDNFAWGMSIDLQSCMGCNACVVACQSENNIPVVGKEQVLAGREMHWIRVDTYYDGSPDDPRAYHQPVPCMHCENAPCELVCPVGATVHDNEGTNNMIYNRCIGTRYCSNNCPYKVRRFNFFEYANVEPTIKMQKNPEVTVRSRGVMEKCSYCIQRVNGTRYNMEKAQVRLEEQAARAAADGDPNRQATLLDTMRQELQSMLDGLQTACQQACPSNAIVFGNINDMKNPGGGKSRVKVLKESPLDYGILTDLNTRPRTTYLARIRNPNGDLEKGSAT
jgi:molybdopterin-containing oxidoreductase family iron-sulfur binding subunit